MPASSLLITAAYQTRLIFITLITCVILMVRVAFSFSAINSATCLLGDSPGSGTGISNQSPCNIDTAFLTAINGDLRCASPLLLVTGEPLGNMINCKVWEVQLYKSSSSESGALSVTVELLIGQQPLGDSQLTAQNYRHKLRFLSSRTLSFPAGQNQLSLIISNYTLPNTCKSGSDLIAPLPCGILGLSLYVSIKSSTSPDVSIGRVTGTDAGSSSPTTLQLSCRADVTDAGCGGGAAAVTTTAAASSRTTPVGGSRSSYRPSAAAITAAITTALTFMCCTRIIC